MFILIKRICDLKKNSTYTIWNNNAYVYTTIYVNQSLCPKTVGQFLTPMKYYLEPIQALMIFITSIFLRQMAKLAVKIILINQLISYVINSYIFKLLNVIIQTFLFYFLYIISANSFVFKYKNISPFKTHNLIFIAFPVAAIADSCSLYLISLQRVTRLGILE